MNLRTRSQGAHCLSNQRAGNPKHNPKQNEHQYPERDYSKHPEYHDSQAIENERKEPLRSHLDIYVDHYGLARLHR